MGFFTSLFGTEAKTQSSRQIPLKEALEIVGNYGEVMESRSPAPGCVADESELPCPKLRIKEAIRIVLQATSDPKMKDALMVGYLQLADWQEGVGANHVGLDAGNFDPNSDIAEMAAKIANQADEFEKWQPIVSAEQEELKKDLIQLGVWRSKST